MNFGNSASTEPWLAPIVNDMIKYDYMRVVKFTWQFTPRSSPGVQSAALGNAYLIPNTEILVSHDWDDDQAPASKQAMLANRGVRIYRRPKQIYVKVRGTPLVSEVFNTAAGLTPLGFVRRPMKGWIGGALYNQTRYPGIKTFFEQPPAGVTGLTNMRWRVSLRVSFQCKNIIMTLPAAAPFDVIPAHYTNVAGVDFPDAAV